MGAIWLLLTLLFSSTCGRVVVVPARSIYIPVNSTINISCQVFGGVFRRWLATIKDDETPKSKTEVGELAPGVFISSVDKNTSLLVINTTHTDLVAVECIGEVGENFEQERERLNITIYGIPDTPTQIAVRVMDKILSANWNFETIGEVSIQYILTLRFICPGEWDVLTGVVNNTQSYSFLLNDSQSCHNFKLCIRASNDVGQGNSSCLEKHLPYVPSLDQILFSLLRESESITAVVTIIIPSTKTSDNLTFMMELTTDQENRTLKTGISQSFSKQELRVSGLNKESIYTLNIISFNSIGMASSELFTFFTGNILGLKVCRSMQEMMYIFSCVYINENNSMGCGFLMTGPNVEEYSGTMDEDISEFYIPNIMSYNRLVIYDSDELVVGIKTFDYSIDVGNCYFANVSTEFPTLSTEKFPFIPSIIAAVIFLCCLLTAIAISTFLIIKKSHICINRIEERSLKLASKNQDYTEQNKNNAETDIPLAFGQTSVSDGKDGGFYNKLSPYRKNFPKEDEDFSRLHQEPIYHVLEKDCNCCNGASSPDSDDPHLLTTSASVLSGVSRDNSTQECSDKLIYDEVLCSPNTSYKTFPASQGVVSTIYN